jgi:hypothetical protein
MGKNLAMLLCTASLTSGCLPTLPDHVYKVDSAVFQSHANVHQNAASCGAHLNSLRHFS